MKTAWVQVDVRPTTNQDLKELTRLIAQRPRQLFMNSGHVLDMIVSDALKKERYEHEKRQRNNDDSSRNNSTFFYCRERRINVSREA